MKRQKLSVRMALLLIEAEHSGVERSYVSAHRISREFSSAIRRGLLVEEHGPPSRWGLLHRLTELGEEALASWRAERNPQGPAPPLLITDDMF